MIAITVIRNFFATSGNKRGQTGQCREGAAGIDSDHDSWNIIIEVDVAAGRWIVLDNSRRIIVDQDVTAAALARVIGVLERR